MTFTHQQDAVHEAEVRQAVTRFCKALNAIFTGNLEPMRAAWSHADDVTYLGPDGAYRKGWAEVLADWERQAALSLGGCVNMEDVRIVAGPALAVVYNHVKGVNLDQECNPVVVSLRATESFRKEAGVWKVIGVHTDLLPLLTD
jgi:ketosteroid isomerase-like protein